MRKSLLLLLLAVVLVALPSGAKTPPVASPSPLPPAVLAEALRAAAISGRVLIGPPTSYEHLLNLPQYTRWRLEWKFGDNRDVSLYIEEKNVRATIFDDSTAEKAREAPSRVNAPIKTTHAQASTICEALAARLRLSSGDWRRAEPKLVLRDYYVQGKYEEGTTAVWAVRKRKYFRGYAIGGQDLSVSIDPYNGRIIEWRLNDDNPTQFHIPESPILSEAEARQRAVKAFAVWTTPVLRSTDVLVPSDSFSGPPGVDRHFAAVWGSMKLYYTYWFTLPYIEDPKRDTYKDPDEWHGRNSVHNFVTIDAETGEFWAAGGAPGSSELPFRNPNRKALSPRRRLLNLLARNKEYVALNSILLNGGMPQQSSAPDAKMFRFTLSVPALLNLDYDFRYETEEIKVYTDGTDARTIPFALDAGRRLLLWELEPTKWYGWKLTAAQTASISEWLQQRKTNGLGAGRIQ